MMLFKVFVGISAILIFVLAFAFAGSMLILYVLEHVK